MLDRNPFPGMNPWLEGDWGDVHLEIISELRDQISTQLPPGLYARMQKTVYLIDPAWDQLRYQPDIYVAYSRPTVGTAAVGSEGILAVAEPLVLEIESEPITQAHIEIRELSTDNPIVTIIELLSPANKENSFGREAYLAKRKNIRSSQTSLVEIDLLRGGPDVLQLPLGHVPPEFRTAAKCAVWRGNRRSRERVEYYPLPLRERLPRIHLPLRPNDPDAVLDLQAPVNAAYFKGGYVQTIDYTRPPDPPLSPEDAAWAAEMIAAAAME